MALSCLSHVKRTADGGRPDAPPVYVDMAAAIDRSGSMGPLLPGSMPGIRAFVENGRQKNGYLEVVTFDDLVEIPYSGPTSQMTAKDVDACVAAVFARNLTRLYDTAIEAIDRQSRRLTAWFASLPRIVRVRLQPKVTVVFFLLTDGLDNQSIANKAAFARVLEHHKKKWGGWSGKGVTAIFAAANQDAMAAGAAYGFSADTCMQMDADPVRVKVAFHSASAAATRACSGLIPTLTQRERQNTSASYHQTTCPAQLNYADDDDSDDDGDFDAKHVRRWDASVAPVRNYRHYPHPFQNIPFRPRPMASNAVQRARGGGAAAAAAAAAAGLPPRRPVRHAQPTAPSAPAWMSKKSNN